MLIPCTTLLDPRGYRPGGFNRGGGKPSSNAAFPDVPLTYATDDVCLILSLV